MGFSIEKLAEQQPNGAIIADRRLFLAGDEKTLVEEGDVTARFQLAAPGHTVRASDVKRLGLSVVDGKVAQAPAADDAPDADEQKQQGAKNDKSRTPGGNKAKTE